MRSHRFRAALAALALLVCAASASAIPVVTPATLPVSPSSGDKVWVDGAASGSCTVQDTPGVRNLCAWSGSAWEFILEGAPSVAGSTDPAIFIDAARVGYDAAGTSLSADDVQEAISELAGGGGGGGAGFDPCGNRTACALVGDDGVGGGIAGDGNLVGELQAAANRVLYVDGGQFGDRAEFYIRPHDGHWILDQTVRICGDVTPPTGATPPNCDGAGLPKGFELTIDGRVAVEFDAAAPDATREGLTYGLIVGDFTSDRDASSDSILYEYDRNVVMRGRLEIVGRNNEFGDVAGVVPFLCDGCDSDDFELVVRNQMPPSRYGATQIAHDSIWVGGSGRVVLDTVPLIATCDGSGTDAPGTECTVSGGCSGGGTCVVRNATGAGVAFTGPMRGLGISGRLGDLGPGVCQPVSGDLCSWAGERYVADVSYLPDLVVDGEIALRGVRRFRSDAVVRKTNGSKPFYVVDDDGGTTHQVGQVEIAGEMRQLSAADGTGVSLNPCVRVDADLSAQPDLTASFLIDAPCFQDVDGLGHGDRGLFGCADAANGSCDVTYGPRARYVTTGSSPTYWPHPIGRSKHRARSPEAKTLVVTSSAAQFGAGASYGSAQNRACFGGANDGADCSDTADCLDGGGTDDGICAPTGRYFSASGLSSAQIRLTGESPIRTGLTISTITPEAAAIPPDLWADVVVVDDLVPADASYDDPGIWVVTDTDGDGDDLTGVPFLDRTIFPATERIRVGTMGTFPSSILDDLVGNGAATADTLDFYAAACLVGWGPSGSVIAIGATDDLYDQAGCGPAVDGPGASSPATWFPSRASAAEDPRAWYVGAVDFRSWGISSGIGGLPHHNTLVHLVLVACRFGSSPHDCRILGQTKSLNGGAGRVADWRSYTFQIGDVANYSSGFGGQKVETKFINDAIRPDEVLQVYAFPGNTGECGSGTCDAYGVAWPDFELVIPLIPAPPIEVIAEPEGAAYGSTCSDLRDNDQDGAADSADADCP